MSEGTDLRVCESHQPHQHHVQHILIIENAVLALVNNTLYELHKVGLRQGMERICQFIPYAQKTEFVC